MKLFGDGGWLFIAGLPYESNGRARAIPGGRWDKSRRAWKWQATPGYYTQLKEAFPEAAESGTEALAGTVAARRRAKELVKNGECQRIEYPFVTTPWKHQRKATVFAANSDAVLLDMWMGTGKSKAVIDTIRWRHHRKTLIVCPLSVIDVWERQLGIHDNGSLRVIALRDGSTAKRAARIGAAFRAGQPAVIVVNYEAMIAKAMKEVVLNIDWDCLVLDEIHRVKQPGGVTSKTAAAIKAGHRIGMTGTPMPHSPLDIYGQYRALDPGIYGASFVKFRDRYAVMGGFQGYQVLGFRNQEDLRQRMDQIRVHVLNDVLDLPEIQTMDIAVELEPECRRFYDKLNTELIAELESETGDSSVIAVSNVLSKLMKLAQVTGGFVYDDAGHTIPAGTAKQDALTDMLEDIGDEPVVVFTRFEGDLRRIEQMAQKTGRDYHELSGRRKELNEWKRGVLGVQIQSGGVGIDLTLARYAIFYSLDYSLGNYQQAVARIHRPGQERPTFIYRLLAKNTVDVKIAAALEKRHDVVKYVLETIREN